jgi:RND family efflux transporter MFP subunit
MELNNMKSSNVAILAIVLIVCVAFFSGCKGDDDKPKAGVGKHGMGGAKEQVVRVWRAEASDFQDFIKVVGTFEPNEEVIVSSEVEAKVTEIFFDEGARVEATEKLVTLDAERFVLKVEKNLADLRKVKVDLEFAEKDLLRKIELVKEGMVTEVAFDEALSLRDSSKAELESVSAALKLSERELEDSKIRAPFAGLLSERLVTQGSYVKKGDSLFRLIDVNPLKFSAAIAEEHLSQIRVGQRIKITLSDDAQTYSGKIYFISPHIDEKTRSFEVKARIKNSKGRLRPGLFADATISTRTIKNVFLLPEKGLVSGRGAPIVYVVEDNVAVKREVGFLKRVDGVVVVSSGFSEGDLIVVDGANVLSDGAKIKIVE